MTIEKFVKGQIAEEQEKIQDICYFVGRNCKQEKEGCLKGDYKDCSTYITNTHYLVIKVKSIFRRD